MLLKRIPTAWERYKGRNNRAPGQARFVLRDVNDWERGYLVFTADLGNGLGPVWTACLYDKPPISAPTLALVHAAAEALLD